VQKAVPVLIQTGHYEHPWLGVSGTPLTPELAKAMGLKPEQQGALVVDVVPGSPADQAGLHGGDRQVTIDDERARRG
jgi:serine protease Do